MKQPRCPNGTRRNKKTGLCKKTTTAKLPRIKTLSLDNTFTRLRKKRLMKQPRCPNGTRRNKKTGLCEKTAKPRIKTLSLDNTFTRLRKKINE